MGVYDKEGDLTSVLRLFEQAVSSTEADADIYCDAIASCFASRKFKVQYQLSSAATSSHLLCVHEL